jgi:small subunit ribosomal protein S20
MPNSSSAAKRMRQGAKRRMRNRVTKKVIKTLSKRTMTALAAKDFNQALEDLKAASSKIDKAGARHVLHPNTAARRKSKLARAYAAAMAKSKQAQAPPG